MFLSRGHHFRSKLVMTDLTFIAIHLQVINYYAGGHVDPMQVGQLLDFHQHICVAVFSPFPSRIPSSDLRIKSILYNMQIFSIFNRFPAW